MMFASMTKSTYTGQLITKLEDCDLLDTNKLRVIDKLHTFLAEEFVPHTDEYYIAIKQMRDGDMIYFSLA